MVKGQRMVQYFRTLILIILSFAICTPPAFAGDISDARFSRSESRLKHRDSSAASLMSVLSSGNVGMGWTRNHSNWMWRSSCVSGRFFQLWSFNRMRFPSKEWHSPRSFWKEPIRASKSFWGSLSHTTPNIFAAGSSAKSLSLVTTTRFSFKDRDDKNLSDVLLGKILTSNPSDIKVSASSARTFSSSKKRKFGIDDDIMIFGNGAGIGKGSLDMPNMKGREGLDNRLWSFSSGEHLENLPDHNAGSFKGGFSVADFGIGDDVFVEDNFHSVSIKAVSENVNLKFVFGDSHFEEG